MLGSRWVADRADDRLSGAARSALARIGQRALLRTPSGPGAGRGKPDLRAVPPLLRAGAEPLGAARDRPGPGRRGRRLRDRLPGGPGGARGRHPRLLGREGATIILEPIDLDFGRSFMAVDRTGTACASTPRPTIGSAARKKRRGAATGLRTHPFPGQVERQRNLIRDPAHEAPRSGTEYRTPRAVPCWVPGRIRLRSMRPGKDCVPDTDDSAGPARRDVFGPHPTPRQRARPFGNPVQVTTLGSARPVRGAISAMARAAAATGARTSATGRSSRSGAFS